MITVNRTNQNPVVADYKDMGHMQLVVTVVIVAPMPLYIEARDLPPYHITVIQTSNYIIPSSFSHKLPRSSALDQICIGRAM